MKNETLKKKFEEIINDKKKGLSDIEIGKKYGITFRQLEKLITETTGLSISSFITEKKIKALEPKDFKEETTTVWSFKQRGNWATHSGEYRGNWSPYIPRNVILRYSNPGEVVLDYFCGAGTTAVESKLLGRRFIGIDINEKAIELAKKNIDFDMNGLFTQIYEPELLVGDARNLSFLEDNSIDLICAHPPYANIIHYTNHKEGDLSFYDIDGFLHEMEKVARESYRVLKPGRHCAILIGDIRRHRCVIPLGFWLINVYLKAGFKLKELVIKRQHNCKTTGFWYKNSIKYNFLLLAHEYLPIFEKTHTTLMTVSEDMAEDKRPDASITRYGFKKAPHELETTTVWIFPENKLNELLNKNVILRYGSNNYKIIDISHGPSKTISHQKKKRSMLFIRSPFLNKAALTGKELSLYLEKIKDIVSMELPFLNKNAFVIIQTKDMRINDLVEPVAKYIVDTLKYDGLKLKEIIIVSMENCSLFYKRQDTGLNLDITHEYLLVYEYRKS